MNGRDVTLKAADGTNFQTYVIGDVGSARPAIILFSPIFGVDDDVKAIAARWADRGYLVAAPDYYFRVAPGICDRSDDGRKQAMARWKALDVDQTMIDMQVLKAYLLAAPSCNGNLAALGYCAGGELAFLAATRLGAKAIATFHGTYIDRHLEEADKIAGRATLHYGDKDPLVPQEQVDAIKARLSPNPNVDIHVYAGAEHGFSFAKRPSYHEVAATASDRRAQDVLGNLKV